MMSRVIVRMKMKRLLFIFCLFFLAWTSDAGTYLSESSAGKHFYQEDSKAFILNLKEAKPDPKLQSVFEDCSRRCEPSKQDVVCGSDGKVYENECQLLRSNCRINVTVTDWEKCRGLHSLCPGRCLEIQDPVCAEDNNIYPNLCIMHSRNCGKNIKLQPMQYCLSRAREFDPCPDHCLDIYKPICGSDGIVYVNECYLRKHTCGKSIHPVGISQCVLVRKCPQMCVSLYDPVCGSDGKLYLNYCIMLQQNCGRKIRKMPIMFCSLKGETSNST